MSFTVGSLLEIEHLGLSLEAGASGLGRSLLWAHVCEIADPRPWLEGGELIMTTGMAVPRQARAQVAYVDRLCEAGVAGLGVAEGMSSPPLTAAMRERADEAGLPILRVSYEVPFIAISRVVFAANHETFERRMLRTLTIFDSLRRGSTVLDSTVAVLDRLEELSGYMLGVASTDRHLVLGDRALAAFLPELPETTPERPVVEVSLSDDRRRYVLPLSIGGRFSGFLLAKEREAGSGLGTLALQNAATVAAVQLAGIQRSRDVYFRIGTEVLHDLFDAALPEARLKRRVELAGLDTAQPLILLAVEGVPEAKERELYDHLCDRGVLALASREGSLVWVAMPAGDTRLLIEDNALEQAFGISRHIGASRIVADFGGMNKAAREARWALAEAIRRQLLFVDSATAFDQGEQLAWLPRDPFLLDRIVEQTLGPLLASDGGGADLLGTIQTFLEEGQRIDASCRRLGIHRHTLSYRLRRIEALTGRSLHDTDDVVELWRAIRARSALAPVEPGAPEKSENPPARSSHASS